MKRSQLTQLGETEIEVLQLVWSLGAATVSDVRDEIVKSRPIAYTTVMTVMKNLASKGFLTFKRAGRKFVYKPARRRSEVQKSVLDEVVDKVFRGSRPELVRSLVSGEDLTVGELDELEALIASMREARR